MKRVLVAGLVHETHTFLAERTGLDRFEEVIWRHGDALLQAGRGDLSPMGGVLQMADEAGWRVYPSQYGAAMPSGTVEDAVLETWWRRVGADLRRALEEGLDGIVLVLHGAMVFESYPDGEGEILARHEGSLPGEPEVCEAMSRFVGEIEQIPPMYSAVKREGVPLHRLARRGEQVERDPKKVVIRSLELLRYEPPDLEIAVDCGPGTYVRTLAHDLGAALGCGAYLSGLRRTRSEPFGLDDALAPEVCEAAARERKLEDMLIPPEVALGLPTTRLAAPAVERLSQGGDIGAGTLERSAPGARVSALDERGRFVALLELRADRRLWPLRVIPRR